MTFPNQGFSPTLSHIDFISQNVGWVVGWYGYAARTSNGGATWTLQNIATQEEILLGLSVLSETEAYSPGPDERDGQSILHGGRRHDLDP